MIWINIVPHIPRSARFTIGARIENKFLDLLELTYLAYFTNKADKEKKLEKIAECILALDKLKFLISVAWEGKIISDKHCENIAQKLEELGRMLGGWQYKIINPEKKDNPPAPRS